MAINPRSKPARTEVARRELRGNNQLLVTHYPSPITNYQLYCNISYFKMKNNFFLLILNLEFKHNLYLSTYQLVKLKVIGNW
ncbi:MAG: hypothetical protein CLLPBCKN_002561 [Chroococcidiopsis cubana SAG 39.79]|nr:hypothetical protein [Chroococcidiopsis cubana SAG 39.79]